ncbi:Dabb family protein [Rhizobium leguminosarum]|uniref:Dabb family protein n=1 Tax=Rhizobium leguminosarum TaxID=384 RepID=UPI001C978280|nr:Dabb family protein [Rhizobium leguminosarum]MBY5587533.1 Dabb family protein [Rhizobium leguminosarum]MBY5600053.1 Dabb family protein [Rhizobium leguminosarum]
MVSRKALTLAFAAALFAQAAQADIQHIVVVKYQANTDAGTKADIAKRFLALKDVAKRDGQPYIVSITGGRAISKEGFDQQLEQAFIVTFKNTADRDYFVGKPYRNTMDPDHLALATIVEPLLHRDVDGKVTGLFVFDFNDGAER